MKKYTLITFLLIIVFRVSSQDLHYTQFYNSPMNFNPALTGIYNGDQRYMVSIRDQWRRIPVPYFTISGGYDMKFYPVTMRRSFFAAGVNFNYDKQGDGALYLANLNLGGSFSYVITPKNLITAGGLLGFAARGFNDEHLKWDAQYDEVTGTYDERLPSNELLDRYGFVFLETGVGLNYRYQHSGRTYFNLGGGVFHLNEPVQTFKDEVSDEYRSRLSRRISLQGTVSFKVIDPLDIQLHGLYQKQGDFDEIVYGGLVKLHINQTRGKKFELHVGVSSRYLDGVSPIIAVQYNDWYAGFNYDVTTSDLQNFNGYRGGPELHVQYVVKHVTPMKSFKFCPIF
ncbi:MAG TPA: PorP/SprF family type IX secretion system membrane protein [Saprospiraceae bacterium]|nr:PorP/SprF family type IX secretion system membrane protein [Saprospiraceae bacterium]